MSQQPFGDIPLFREIQRILSAGEGPINLEIAKQVASAIANQQGADPTPDPKIFGWYTEAARTSELVLAGFMRASLEEPVLARTVTRTGWIDQTMQGWRWLLEHTAKHLAGEVTRLSGEGEQESNPMQAVMGQIAPLLLGMQAGTLLGHLSTESLGRFDPMIPRDDDGRLFFVATNVAQLTTDYGFDLETFCRWLALHDVARHMTLTRAPWVQPYFRSVLTDLIEAIEIDAGDFEQRLTELQEMGPEALQQGMGAKEVLPITDSERHRVALARLRAFLALVEGYARHAAGEVGHEILGEVPQIDEGIARWEASPSEGKSMLASLLGISIDRSLHTAGKTFCAAVVKLHGVNDLNKVWDAPDNLPTVDEIRDPFAWMERVLESDETDPSL